jgi:hypothetical protein
MRRIRHRLEFTTGKLRNDVLYKTYIHHFPPGKQLLTQNLIHCLHIKIIHTFFRLIRREQLPDIRL